jgi:putative DNA primase/helicase
MFLMSSIATALKQGADRSRFAQLTLRSPTEIPKQERIKHWEGLDRDLDHYINQETGRRLIARTVSLIPVIRESIRVFTRVAAEHFDSQRLGDQYGTLLAGTWSLYSRQVPTDDEARNLIKANNWEPYSQATEIPDEQRCIRRILQYQLRVETDEKTCSRAVGELVEIAMHHATDIDVQPSAARNALERHGLKVDPEVGTLFVSNTAEAIATMLRDTQWSHSWGTLLSRLKGASKAEPMRFKGAGTLSRAVALQISDL